MFGSGGKEPAAELLAAVVFRPTHLVQLAVCSGIAFLLPNTAQFLSKLSPWKLWLGLALLFISVRVLAVQGHNPFLYFQF
jgi:hypothetical protein